MKKFRDFLENPNPPVIIYALPTHGAHSVAPTSNPLDEAKFSSKEEYHRENDNSHIGSHDEVDNHVSEGADKHIGKLKYEQKTAVNAYSTSSYHLNHHLISKHTGKEDTANKYFGKEHHERLEGIDHHLSNAIKSSKLKKDMHLYHGTTGFNPGKEAAKHPEGHIKLPAYTSTTHDKVIATDFSNPTKVKSMDRESHIIKIHAKKGTHALHVAHHSRFEHEKETIIHKNAVLKIHKKPDVIEHTMKERDSLDNLTGKTFKRRTYVWHAHVVDDGTTDNKKEKKK